MIDGTGRHAVGGGLPPVPTGRPPRHAADSAESDEPATDRIRVDQLLFHLSAQPSHASDDAVTEVIPTVTPAAPVVQTRLVANSRRRRQKRLRSVAWFAGAAIAVLGIAYGIDMFASSGKVPRGVTVAGVGVGGMNNADALEELQEQIGARATAPLALQVGDVGTELVPATSGLAVNWEETMDRIGSQPISPITRVTSLFSTHNVDIVTAVDDPALTRSLAAVQAKADRPAVEGTIRFDGATPVPVRPVPGQMLDVPRAKTVLEAGWADGTGLDLPVTIADVTVTDAAIETAIRDVARPAVATDVVFTGKSGRTATLRPEQTGSVLAFAPDGQGGLTPQIKTDAAIALLAPQLAPSEVTPKDAVISVASGSPKVIPAVVGDLVQWQKTLDQLPPLLVAPTPRTVAAVYEPVQPKLTTEAANALGIKEVIAEFTTGGFESASGINIRKVASVVNGAIVKPGDTFSLNDFTGPRGAAQGYVESGIIDHGRPSKAIGGGISQFATTLYNATYFAGLEDVTHTEHSYFISRYPEAREATVFEGAIDLQFKNNTKTGIFIEASGTSSNVTVRIWGTKTVGVESVTGARTAPTEPQPITLPKGNDCVPSKGAPGFTASNTRIITDRVTGQEVYRHTRTVKYDPVPIVKCE